MEKLPCINCLLLGRCRAQIFDEAGESIYGEYNKSVTINLLMSECVLLNDYITVKTTISGIEYDKPIVERIPLVVDYLISGVVHEEDPEDPV